MSKEIVRIETALLSLDYFARGGTVTRCPTRTAQGGTSKQRRNVRSFLREEVRASGWCPILAAQAEHAV